MTEFWAALFGALAGALAAFLLEALRRWVADNARRQSSINLAALSLVQMYTLMKNYHDQVFVDGRETLIAQLPGGREPLAFEYLPAGGLPEQQLAIDYESLGCLVRSHDPDVLHRVLAAERIFLGARHAMLEHERLHRLVQRRLAEQVDPMQPIAVRQLPNLVGGDLFKQLTDIATLLRDETPKDMQQILAAASQLREVARFHFPFRRFIGFDVVPRREAMTPPKDTRQPAWWRRTLRGLVSKFRSERKC